MSNLEKTTTTWVNQQQRERIDSHVNLRVAHQNVTDCGEKMSSEL